MSDNGRDFWEGAVTLTAAAQKFHTPLAITAPYEGSSLEFSVFVYCYQQEKTIAATLDTVIEAVQVAEKSFEIIVIDDASKDGSVEAVRAYMSRHDEQQIVLRVNKEYKGINQNYTDAAFIGIGKYYRLVYGDNAEPVSTLVDIARTVGEADIIIPYYVPSMGETPRWQGLIQRYNGMLNVITGKRINDYTTIPVHLRYNVMRWHVNSNGIGAWPELLCQLLDLGFTYKQVPCRAVTYRSFEEGISWKNTFSLLHTLLNVILRRISSRYYRR